MLPANKSGAPSATFGALKLPGHSLQYDVYRMRLAQIKILQARGYAIPKSLQYLLSSQTRDKEKFTEFSRQWAEAPPVENGVYYYYDTFTLQLIAPPALIPLTSLSSQLSPPTKATKEGTLSDSPVPRRDLAVLHSFISDVGTVEAIIVDMTRQTVIASADPRAFLNLQIIASDNYKGELIYGGMNIEVLPYQRIFVDPTTHRKAAAAYDVLPKLEANVLLSSPKMRGADFPRMGPLDPLTLYLGTDFGDVLRLYNNSTCSGLTTSRVLYRRVKET